MHDNTQGNAMTEIALAMAMGFFAIMVLTMMSMGVGVGTSKQRAIDTAMLAPPAARAGPATDAVRRDDLLVIFDGRRFLDRLLEPLDKSKIAGATRVILALPPELSMEAAMKARQRLRAKNLVITTLDRRWRQALKRRTHDRR